MRIQHGENLQSASFLPKNTSCMFLFHQPQTIFPEWSVLSGLVPRTAQCNPHHTALSHGLEEQQNRILLVHTARTAAKNPFTIDTILWQEKLQNLQKIFLFFGFVGMHKTNIRFLCNFHRNIRKKIWLFLKKAFSFSFFYGIIELCMQCLQLRSSAAGNRNDFSSCLAPERNLSHQEEML